MSIAGIGHAWVVDKTSSGQNEACVEGAIHTLDIAVGPERRENSFTGEDEFCGEPGISQDHTYAKQAQYPISVKVSMHNSHG